MTSRKVFYNCERCKVLNGFSENPIILCEISQFQCLINAKSSHLQIIKRARWISMVVKRSSPWENRGLSPVKFVWSALARWTPVDRRERASSMSTVIIPVSKWVVCIQNGCIVAACACVLLFKKNPSWSFLVCVDRKTDSMRALKEIVAGNAWGRSVCSIIRSTTLAMCGRAMTIAQCSNANQHRETLPIPLLWANSRNNARKI